MSILPAPSHTMEYLQETYAGLLGSSEMKPSWRDNPKSPVQNHVMAFTGGNPKYEVEEGHVEGRREKTFRYVRVHAHAASAQADDPGCLPPQSYAARA